MLLNCGVGEDSLRDPCTARRSNQSILKEISPGCSLEGLMLKLKFQYFCHLMRRADSFEKTLILGNIEGRRRRGWQNKMVEWHHRLDGHGFGWTLGVGDGQEGLACCGSWGRKELDMTEWLNWSELGFGKCFGASSQSRHWVGHHQLSYKIHFSLYVTVWWRNGSLLQRIRENDSSKRWFFFIFGQLTRHLLIEVFHLSNFLQRLNHCRMVDVEFFSNFLCS